VAERGRRLAAGVGVVYAGAAMLAPALLRGSPTQGMAAIFWLFAVVWGTDIGAYFGGRLIGGPKLWPSISPGKTWSGALVGAAVSAVLGWLIAALAVPGGVKVLPLIGLGLITSALSQGGDLYESAMKRRAGVKDSSHLIPGHGGLMDRLDGFIVAAAFAAAVAWARSQGPWIAPGLFQW
jgi:phosphatidate cytidylyltransferase